MGATAFIRLFLLVMWTFILLVVLPIFLLFAESVNADNSTGRVDILIILEHQKLVAMVSFNKVAITKVLAV